MNQPPLCSICVPLYNKKDYLTQTLETVLGQTYSNIEVVVSDNGSTDGSSDIAREFANRDSRVRYFRLENTVDVNESFRYCFQLAQGEFIKQHSGDDTTLPANFLERMIAPMLHQPELQFAVCAVRPVVEFTATGYSAEGQANYFNRVTQVTRAVLALPSRANRARMLLETVSMANFIGTTYSIVFRRLCLPRSHWRNCLTVYAWPESYPDWDFNLRLFLNHRGVFVDDVTADMYYDAHSVNVRAILDNKLDLLDMINHTLQPLTILIDPELAIMRQQARPDELAALIQSVQSRIPALMDLSDEVVAFDSPHFTAKLIPRLQQYVETYRRNRRDWIAARRVRQHRINLVEHWLKTPPERIGQEYFADPGRAHLLLLDSGIRQDAVDVREKSVLERVLGELSEDMTTQASWGRWLAVVLLANFQTLPHLKLELVPEWLRSDFGSYAWTA
jgi:glycosyltransferase involved in cell wall biosynthesis